MHMITRKPRKGTRRNRGGYEPLGAFRNRKTINYRCVNNSADLEEKCDGANDLDGDRGCFLLATGRPLNQVNLDGDNSAPVEIEFSDIENRHGDTKSGNYSVNRIAPDSYRDSGRSGDCDVFETSAIRNLARRNRAGAKGIGVKISESHLGAIWINTKSPR